MARDQTIERALAWLRTRQQPDGGVDGGNHRAALTALAVLAHSAAGVLPDHPLHGGELRRGLRFILANQTAGGYFGAADGSRMYGHGLTTICLTQAVGMTGDEDLEDRLRDSLRRAVAVTVAAARVAKDANQRGGWHYEPNSGASDMSLTGWQLTSLQAARSIGLAVPDEIIANAAAYVRRMTTADGNVGYNAPGQDRAALRGMACAAFAYGGKADDPLVPAIVQRIVSTQPGWSGEWWFYRAYYDATGLARVAPDRWREIGPAVVRNLTTHQNPDGSIQVPPGCNEGAYGAIYCTGMAVLVLALDRHLLPAYQR